MKKYIKYSGLVFIGIAVFTVLNLPNMIYPVIDDGGMDITQYNLEVTINVIRYIALAVFSFVLGVKVLFPIKEG